MAAIASIQVDSGLRIEVRQSKYFDNIFEQGHHAVNRFTRRGSASGLFLLASNRSSK